MDEPGRSVGPDGRDAWPPEGRLRQLWDRFTAAFPDDDERHDLLALLLRWRSDSSLLVAYTDEAGNWIEVDWSDVP